MRQFYDNPWKNPAGIFFILFTFPVGLLALSARGIGYRLYEEKLTNIFTGDL